MSAQGDHDVSAATQLDRHSPSIEKSECGTYSPSPFDIDGQRLPFAGSSNRKALVVIVPFAVLQTASVGRRRIRAGNRLRGDFEKDRGTDPVQRFRGRIAFEI